uniref:Uncharacterized protein n=1 Tax=Aegilops tauschii TaxID=37682 RepID=N1R3V5_AEGTA
MCVVVEHGSAYGCRLRRLEKHRSRLTPLLYWGHQPSCLRCAYAQVLVDHFLSEYELCYGSWEQWRRGGTGSGGRSGLQSKRNGRPDLLVGGGGWRDGEALIVEGGVYDACDHACNICLEAFCDSDSSTVATSVLQMLQAASMICISGASLSGEDHAFLPLQFPQKLCNHSTRYERLFIYEKKRRFQAGLSGFGPGLHVRILKNSIQAGLSGFGLDFGPGSGLKTGSISGFGLGGLEK